MNISTGLPDLVYKYFTTISLYGHGVETSQAEVTSSNTNLAACSNENITDPGTLRNMTRSCRSAVGGKRFLYY